MLRERASPQPAAFIEPCLPRLAYKCVRSVLQCLKPRTQDSVGIGKGRHPAYSVLSLADKLACEETDAICVAVLPRQRGHKSGPQHIAWQDVGHKRRRQKTPVDLPCKKAVRFV
jgi:hypothetical protein